MTEQQRAILFMVFIMFICGASILSSFVHMDFSGPVLSERNPNGTIDYWYIGDRASK